MQIGKRTVYKIGTQDPVIKSDPGAGPWTSKMPTPDMVILKNKILDHLPHAYFLIGDNAVKHMLHYLGCTGSDYTIDFQGMIDEVRDAQDFHMENAVSNWSMNTSFSIVTIGTKENQSIFLASPYRTNSWADSICKAWPGNSICMAPLKGLFCGIAIHL